MLRNWFTVRVLKQIWFSRSVLLKQSSGSCLTRRWSISTCHEVSTALTSKEWNPGDVMWYLYLSSISLSTADVITGELNLSAGCFWICFPGQGGVWVTTRTPLFTDSQTPQLCAASCKRQFKLSGVQILLFHFYFPLVRLACLPSMMEHFYEQDKNLQHQQFSFSACLWQ